MLTFTCTTWDLQKNEYHYQQSNWHHWYPKSAARHSFRCNSWIPGNPKCREPMRILLWWRLANGIRWSLGLRFCCRSERSRYWTIFLCKLTQWNTLIWLRLWITLYLEPRVFKNLNCYLIRYLHKWPSETSIHVYDSIYEFCFSVISWYLHQIADLTNGNKKKSKMFF